MDGGKFVILQFANMTPMKETQNIEFKRQWRDDFLAELCGFANTQGV